ncbi:CD209 antigen-like protein A, partial [Anolis sagrei]|uniref:CD209 antigen-like protein A n=1 Tax=Anolis sagrei TaxID=38937 RepID=UPI003522D8FD
PEVDKKIQQIKEFLHRPVAFLLATILVIITFVIAALFVPLAYREWYRTANLRQATEMVKEFMMARNASFLPLSDVELVLEADKVAKVLANTARMLDAIDVDIEYVRYQLNHDWTAFQGAIYYFEIVRIPWYQAKRFCKKAKAKMIKIETDAEEEFVENELKTRDVPYWLGILKTGKKFVWDMDQTPVNKFYWAHGEPSRTRDGTPSYPLCISVKHKCFDHLRCWQTNNCDEIVRPLCEQKPKQRWYKD